MGPDLSPLTVCAKDMRPATVAPCMHQHHHEQDFEQGCAVQHIICTLLVHCNCQR